LTSSRELYLAGLLWPGEAGLDGHSDGDVASHAICTALLSAAGLGDPGANFGTSRPEWAGASGVALLRETFRLISDAGFVIGNVGGAGDREPAARRVPAGRSREGAGRGAVRRLGQRVRDHHRRTRA
jgi:hypothetical protein